MIIYILSIFLSAFLLFQVQPLIGKLILPWFGGTPAVWSTIILFFQVLLTGGYAYAFWLVDRVQPRKQGKVHLAVLGIALLLLVALAFQWVSPITPPAGLRPADVDQPIWDIFKLLAIAVGLPYFVLAANSTLVQTWFSRANPGRSPYWLYALSNVGSLLALVSYPVLVEPTLALHTQGWTWAISFLVFAALTGTVALQALRAENGEKETEEAPTEPQPEPTFSRQLLWIALAATASILLLAVTNQLTQEVAAIPFLWVLPLVMYLLSFVLAFSGEGRYNRPLFTILLALGSGGLFFILDNTRLDFPIQIAIYAFFLFAACMVAHGELYRLRPDSAHLSRFYLMVSIGGALGGVIVTLIAPVLFKGFWEFYIGWVLIWLLLVVLLVFVRPTNLTPRWRMAHDVLVGLLTISVLVVSVSTISSYADDILYNQRNFYGLVRVYFDQKRDANRFVNGITLHGFQYNDPAKRDTPTSYFWEGSGIAMALRSHPDYKNGMRVGVMGLGIGTLASYGQPGDYYRFYEINPLIANLALGKDDLFSFLDDSQADVDVVLGDARISLENELNAGQRQDFDLLVMDAFSSDSIPVHLVTGQAFEIYMQHLSEDGIIAIDITNHYINLEPVLVQLAREFGLTPVSIWIPAPDNNQDAYSSWWMLLARDPNFVNSIEVIGNGHTYEDYTTDIPIWTDDYSNLFQVLR